MRKYILILFVCFLTFENALNAFSKESVILIDADSKRVLFEENAHDKLPMASTTKIMTGLIAAESGRLNETVKVSSFAEGTEGSSLYIKRGETYTLENLTYGLMLNSANDSAVAIAEFLGGSIDAFSLLMNLKAKEIGALNTNFENPHGLSAENHYTTAYDLAIISSEAMKNELFCKIVSAKTYKITDTNNEIIRFLKNHNKLLWQYDGCIGVKTGYTKQSGRCLVSCAERNDQRLICVTLNVADDWKKHTSLLDYGFSNFKSIKLAEKGEFAYKYYFEENNSVNLLYGDDFKISLQDSDKITSETEFCKLDIPAEKGTQAGNVKIFCNEELIGNIPLLTEEKLEKPSFSDRILKYIKRLFS